MQLYLKHPKYKVAIFGYGEDVALMMPYFNTQYIIALDITRSVFDRIAKQIGHPSGYIQSFTMTPNGYLYFYCPSDEVFDRDEIKFYLQKLHIADDL